MTRQITGYHQDELADWVAELSCGHFQHVRHNPPWTNRVWIITSAGRAAKLSAELRCQKCVEGAPMDKK